MEPAHVLLEKLNRGLITRREYFKRLAALGLATPMVLAASKAQRRRKTTATIAPEFPSQDEINGNADRLPGLGLRADHRRGQRPHLRGEYTENVDYQTVSGDYGLIIDTMQLNNEPLDMFYSHESGIARHVVTRTSCSTTNRGGISSAPKRRCTPPFGTPGPGTDGKLYGLPYYTASAAR